MGLVESTFTWQETEAPLGQSLWTEAELGLSTPLSACFLQEMLLCLRNAGGSSSLYKFSGFPPADLSDPFILVRCSSRAVGCPHFAEARHQARAL